MKKILCLICVLLLCGANDAFANFSNMTGGLNPGAINSMETRNLRIHEYNVRNRQQSAIVKPKKDDLQQTISSNATGTIKSIIFVDNHSISTQELNVIVNDKIDSPMNAGNVSEIRKHIMKYYQANGFYSAVPSIVSYDNSTGELVIQIKEGSKNSIVIE